MLFELGEWLPDQPALGNPGATVAKNTYPVARGYAPFGSLMYLSTAIDARPLGGTSLTSDDGTSRVYVGNDTKLYSLDAATVTDRSIAGGYTNTATFWDFCAYGDVAISTNFVDAPQFMDMSAGVDFAVLTTDFRARSCAVVRDFVMFVNTYDAADGNVPIRARWSALGDYTDYTISATTQADYQDTPGAGEAVRVFGGEYAVILFENGIYRVNYVGSPLIWQFDEVVTGIGLFAPGAAAQNGQLIFFLDSAGFYVFDGSKTTAIGNTKIDDWFWGQLDASQAAHISCAIDHDKKCCVWSFPGQLNVAGKPTHMVLFNYELNRWSYAEIDHDIILPLLTSDITIDTLDNLNNNVDDLTISVDSRVLFQGSSLLGVMDSFKLASNQGTPLTAVLESKEMQPNATGRTRITEAWPMIDGGTTTFQVGSRDRQQDTVSWTTATSVNSTGFAPIDAEGRYLRIRMNVSGTWDDAQGSDVNAKARGRF
jgi:hypothetical protein